MEQSSSVGRSARRVDALAKVKGSARFSDDIRMERMVYGKLLHSPHAHARILSVSVDKAKAVPGVLDVILADDLYQNRDIGEESSWLLARDEVCYLGDRIALVIAESADAAEAGVRAIEVRYLPLPAVTDLESGAKPDSPLSLTTRSSNIAMVLDFPRGDVDGLFAKADVVVSDHFSFPTLYQAHLEPNSATATYEDGELTVYCASQVWFRLRCSLADLTGVPEERIHIRPQHIGGAFGSRNEQAAPVIAAIMAIRTGRPAKITYTREEEFYASHCSVEFQIEMSIAADCEGNLLAKRCHYYTDLGAYDVAGQNVTWVACTRSDALYRFRATHTVGEGIYTNRAPTNAYRGYGNPQAHFAMENLIDRIAEKLGMSPVEIRRKNFIGPNMTAGNGYRISSNQLQLCLTRAIELSGWEDKYQKLPVGKGIGLAAFIHAAGSRAGEKEFSGGSAMIKAELSGRITVYVGEAEIGQGSKTVMAQIAAEELGLPPEELHIVMGDTDACPFSTGTHGSKLTTVLGNAVLSAAKELSGEICRCAAAVYGVERASLSGGNVLSGDGSVLGSLKEVLYCCCVSRSGRPFIAQGTFEPDAELMDDNGYGSVAATYPFGVQVVELTVREDGKVIIDQITSVHDSGRIINPQMALGQVYGGVTQACGFTQMEHSGQNKQGILTAGTFLEYKMPTALDIPQITGEFVEVEDPYGPYGAKALGELPIIGVAAAASNAYYQATGQQLTELPYTPKRVLKQNRQASASAGKGDA